MKRGIVILGVLLALMAGCSHLSVKHLEKNPFHLDQTEQLTMRFWDFEYGSRVENGDYVVAGVAFPKTEVLPDWAEWLHGFWLSVYLSDEKGKVLASDLMVFPTQRVGPEGVKFEFNLSPDRMPAGKDTYLTFGYRMSLTQSRDRVPLHEKPLTGERSVFFASEGALAR